MKAESVNSREQLADFVDALRDSLHKQPDEWENRSLEEYLESLAAFARDMPGYYENFGGVQDSETPTWSLFADLLAGARVYE
jgi:hypothetical protein